MLSELFSIVVPVYACAAIGFLWVRMGRGFDTRLMTDLVFFIGSPCLTFSSLVSQSIDLGVLRDMLVAVFLAVVVPLRRLGRARAALFSAARLQRDELVREVEMAAAVQRHLLDQHRPPAGPLEIVARTEPARVVGGDYYDFVAMADGRLAVVVVDISGKGLPAALLMPAVKIALRTLVVQGNRAYVQVGAGIVADSVPAEEFQETLNKARGLLKAIEITEARREQSRSSVVPVGEG